MMVGTPKVNGSNGRVSTKELRISEINFVCIEKIRVRNIVWNIKCGGCGAHSHSKPYEYLTFPATVLFFLLLPVYCENKTVSRRPFPIVSFQYLHMRRATRAPNWNHLHSHFEMDKRKTVRTQNRLNSIPFRPLPKPSHPLPPVPHKPLWKKKEKWKRKLRINAHDF